MRLLKSKSFGTMPSKYKSKGRSCYLQLLPLVVLCFFDDMKRRVFSRYDVQADGIEVCYKDAALRIGRCILCVKVQLAAFVQVG